MIKVLVVLPLIGRITQDRGRSPAPATSILQMAVRSKYLRTIPRATPRSCGRILEIPAPAGALYVRSPFLWRLEERVLEKSTGASIGNARFMAGPSSQNGKSQQMIKGLVVLPLIGRITIIIVWHRKDQR